MSLLYIISSSDRSKFVEHRARCLISNAHNIETRSFTTAERLRELLELINNDVDVITHSYFAVDGFDDSASRDFNAFVYALRMAERLHGVHPRVIRSLNII